MKPEKFKVVTVDTDGTVQLANLDMKARGVRNFTTWAASEIPLKRGQTVFGTFDFDPSDSLIMGKMPTFQPVEVTAGKFPRN